MGALMLCRYKWFCSFNCFVLSSILYWASRLIVNKPLALGICRTEVFFKFFNCFCSLDIYCVDNKFFNNIFCLSIQVWISKIDVQDRCPNIITKHTNQDWQPPNFEQILHLAIGFRENYRKLPIHAHFSGRWKGRKARRVEKISLGARS